MTKRELTIPNTNDCIAAQPLLTALFDGQAEISQERQAATHLRSCSECAQLWRSWESTRSFMRAAEGDTPLVPPTLATEVLSACELRPSKLHYATAAKRAEEYERLARLPGRADLRAALNEATLGEESRAALAPFFAKVAVPLSLKTSILAAARSAAGSRLGAKRNLSWERLAAWPASVLPRASTVRWGGAALVPAAMALIFYTQGPFATTPTSVIAPEDATPTAVTPSVDSSEALTDPASAKSVVAKPVSPAKSTINSLTPKPTKSSMRLSTPARVAPSIPADVAAPAVKKLSFYSVSTSHSSATQSTQSAPTPIRIVASATHVRVIKAKLPATVRQRVIPAAVTSASTSTLRPVVARLSSGRGKTLPWKEVSGRISSPVIATRIAAVFPGDKFDAAFSAVSHWRDDRPADISSVVDDYRATLARNDTNNNTDDDFGEEM